MRSKEQQEKTGPIKMEQQPTAAECAKKPLDGRRKDGHR
jgi:hypothetical protein